MLFSVKLTNAHTVCGRPTLKNSTECFRNGLFRELKGKQRKLSRHSMTSKTYGPHRRNEKSKYQECTCKIDKSFNREIFKMFVSSKICKGGYQSGNSDCDFCNGEHNKFPVSVAGCQQLKPQRTESYENCVVEEIKEVELRSRRGKFIYKRNYSSVELNKVSYFSRRCRAPSRLPVKKLKSLLQKTRKVRVFVWKGIRKNTPLSSKIHCYVNNRNCLELKRYRSTSPKFVRKRGKVYLSSKHQTRGDLSWMRCPSRILSKYSCFCTGNYPFYSAYKSLNHLVNFEQVKLFTDIEKNPGPSIFVDGTKTIHAPYCQANVSVFGENAGQQCVAISLSALIYSKIRRIYILACH